MPRLKKCLAEGSNLTRTERASNSPLESATCMEAAVVHGKYT